MLALEAKLTGVGEVALVDSQYLAAFLCGIERSRVDAFADFAIVPDPAPEPTKDDVRAEAVERRLAEDAARHAEAATTAVSAATEEGYRFVDDPSVKSTLVALKRALLESRGGPDLLTTYREYVQNAADAIDLARAGGHDAGRIEIVLNASARAVTIRDDAADTPASLPARTYLSRCRRQAGDRGLSLPQRKTNLAREPIAI